MFFKDSSLELRVIKTLVRGVQSCPHMPQKCATLVRIGEAARSSQGAIITLRLDKGFRHTNSWECTPPVLPVFAVSKFESHRSATLTHSLRSHRHRFRSSVLSHLIPPCQCLSIQVPKPVVLQARLKTVGSTSGSLPFLVVCC